MRVKSNKSSEKTTFWTMCPYCYYMHEYSTLYEDCCLMCSTCNRGFHGVSVTLPPLQDKNHYYCGFGVFSVEYLVNVEKDGSFGQKQGIQGGSRGGINSPVTISDNDDGDNGNGGGEMGVVKNGEKCKGSKMEERKGNYNGAFVKKSGGYVKSVAKNSKKVFGKGKKVIA